VSADGRYSINKTQLPDRSVETVAAALGAAANGGKDSVVIISADASAAHQSVITVMEGARRAGLMQITFATQSAAQAGR
jgi:biopolymer transport protein ExbD